MMLTWLRPSVLFGSSFVVLGCAGDQEIERPTPLYGDIPIEYPIGLWDQDIEGQTLLRVRVTDAGRVDSVEVVESSGLAAFDSAAMSGARELRFQPAQRDGKRIAVWAQVPVHFSKDPRPPGGDASVRTPIEPVRAPAR